MDVSLSKVQMDIAKEARRFLDKECPTDYARDMYEDERGFTDEIWAKMIEMDWMRVHIPEQYGGIGMDQMDLTMVLEEMGRAVFPGPFFSTVLLAAEAIMEAGSNLQKERYLPGIAAGKIKGTLALHEPDGGADLGYIQMEARANGDGFVLDGTKISVPDAHVADFLVCAARTKPGNDLNHGITLFLVDFSADGVFASLLPTMDGARKLCAVDFKAVQVSQEAILGDLHKGWKHLSRVLQRAQVGICAECVGGAQRAMEIATEYAKIRVQFDQPIGAFQAIKHRCAQMYVEVESSRSILYWAAWTQDHGDPKEAAMAASVAKAYCSEAYTHVSSAGIQILGGTGFAWENEMQLYLKRAKANEQILGDPIYHREQVMKLLTD
jgi:alkylation response protein AidB-like acyl-CoA dehydrogenase